MRCAKEITNKNVVDEEGICPNCRDQEGLNYDRPTIDEYMKFPWECPVCDAKGEEIYRLTFIKHILNKEATNDDNL